ncbi:hypothetical protein Peur_003596 [Populus x canadensis]
MASSSTSSSLTSNLVSSPFYPSSFSKSPSLPLLSFSQTLKPFPNTSKLVYRAHSNPTTAVKAQTVDFAGSFYEGGIGSEDEPDSPIGSGTITAVEEKETPPCPPGLRQYETMAVLRPDMSEDERLALTQKYEEMFTLGAKQGNYLVACCWWWHVCRGIQQRGRSTSLQHQEKKQSWGV